MNGQKDKEIYLISGFNRAYLEKAEPYLITMNENSNVHNIIVTLDFDVDAYSKEKYGSIKFVKILSSQVISPNTNTCMQHGGFLDAMKSVEDDAIIVFTDSDINIQRGFTENELTMLRSFSDDEVGVNYCREPAYLLIEEMWLLRPNVSLEKLLSIYPHASELTVFNTGVIVANHRTYKKLYEAYNSQWEAFKGLFDHFAKQQWLLSYLIQTRFRPRILPYTIHSHGCKHPIGLRVDERVANYKFCIGPDVVVLNHKIIHPLHKTIKSQRRIIKRLVIAMIVLGIICVCLMISLLIK